MRHPLADLYAQHEEAKRQDAAQLETLAGESQPATNDADPIYIAAIEYVKSRGYDDEAAKSIVERWGAEEILAGKEEQERRDKEQLQSQGQQ